MLKIAILLLNNNGDILYATPIAKQIKQYDFPGCHLTWIVAEQCIDILKGNEYIDKLDVVSLNRINEIYEGKWATIEMLYKSKLNRGEYDKLFILQPFDRNYLKYKSCIRRMILDSYPYSINVPLKPLLRLSTQEKLNVHAFIKGNEIENYQNRILYEFAPSSGQANISTEEVLNIAAQIVKMNSSTCVILSSNQDLEIVDEHVFSAKSLTFKENSELINYCTLLLGCSSGISWLSTSDYCKAIPTIQFLNYKVPWFNSLKFDFKINNISIENVIELYNFDKEIIVRAVDCFLKYGLARAKSEFDQELRKEYLLNNFYTISNYFFQVQDYKRLFIFFINNLKGNIGITKNNFRFMRLLYRRLIYKCNHNLL